MPSAAKRTTLSVVSAPDTFDGPLGDILQASRLLSAVTGRFARLSARDWLATAKQLHIVLDEAEKRSARQRLVVVK